MSTCVSVIKKFTPFKPVCNKPNITMKTSKLSLKVLEELNRILNPLFETSISYQLSSIGVKLVNGI